MKNVKIAITGATGFVGRNLVSSFTEQGYQIIPLSRTDVSGSPENLAEKMRGAEVIVNLAGAPIIARWTSKYKKTLFDSRINTTSAIVRAFDKMAQKPSLFISTSAVGYYAEGRHTEDDFKRADDFLGKLTGAWEEEALKAATLGVRTVIFRMGVVLGKGGGALARMHLPFNLGLGGTIGDGSQGFSWVQMRDLERAFLAAITESSFSGAYNLTAPNPTTNRGLTEALGKALGKPTKLPVPKFALKLIFGEGAAVLTNGQQVYPKRLLEAGFKFEYPDIESALNVSL